MFYHILNVLLECIDLRCFSFLNFNNILKIFPLIFIVKDATNVLSKFAIYIQNMPQKMFRLFTEVLIEVFNFCIYVFLHESQGYYSKFT